MNVFRSMNRIFLQYLWNKLHCRISFLRIRPTHGQKKQTTFKAILTLNSQSTLCSSPEYWVQIAHKEYCSNSRLSEWGLDRLISICFYCVCCVGKKGAVWSHCWQRQRHQASYIKLHQASKTDGVYTVKQKILVRDQETWWITQTGNKTHVPVLIFCYLYLMNTAQKHSDVQNYPSWLVTAGVFMRKL